jgi:uncharacterized Tic20 family protein
MTSRLPESPEHPRDPAGTRAVPTDDSGGVEGQQRASTDRPLSASDEKLWATLGHLSIPFLGVIGPLVAFLVLRNREPFVRGHAIEAMNFSILYTVAQIFSAMLTVLLVGYVLLSVVLVAALVLCAMAAVAANRGEAYRYPVNSRLVR